MVKVYWKVSRATRLPRVTGVILGYRLVPAMRECEREFAALATLGSFIGGIGLVCLVVFDTKRHTSLHHTYLLVFILGVGISAIFSVAEVRFAVPAVTHCRALI